MVAVWRGVWSNPPSVPHAGYLSASLHLDPCCGRDGLLRHRRCLGGRWRNCKTWSCHNCRVLDVVGGLLPKFRTADFGILLSYLHDAHLHLPGSREESSFHDDYPRGLRVAVAGLLRGGWDKWIPRLRRRCGGKHPCEHSGCCWWQRSNFPGKCLRGDLPHLQRAHYCLAPAICSDFHLPHDEGGTRRWVASGDHRQGVVFLDLRRGDEYRLCCLVLPVH
mmetsp:Transcript_27284/g.71921  ORF Transcript_27284/g.71921 Transcript_27284/m.71921 type:complete len:220 (-) Transcript_27284:404-1063(-)